MIEYNGYTIFTVNTLGYWYGMIYRNDILVHETMAHTDRDSATATAKMCCARVG